MASVTVSVPDEIRSKMKQFPEINWSGLVKKIIENKVEELFWKEEMKKKLAEEKEFNDWTVQIGRKVNKDIAGRLKKESII